MADTAVEFLLENLKQLLIYNANLILGVKDQVESLCGEVRLLASFVKAATEKRSEHAVLKELVRQIRAVVYAAEDVIDKYVIQAALQKGRSKFRRAFHAIDYPAELRKIAVEMEPIRQRVKEIYDNKLFGFEALQAGEAARGGPPERRPPVVEEDNVVGFDEEAKMLVDRLTGGEEELEVISVIGMGGLGKTTLAKKVFNDPSIQYEFFTRAWIYVSQEYKRKDVFLGILSCITQLTDEMNRMNDEMLAEKLRRELQGGRYLIVVDDVWTNEAWDDLKTAFPNNNNRSRILLTSRNRDVAVYAYPDIPPHHLRFLTPEKSWELLQYKVFRRGRCPSELEVLGQKIAKKCDGLPLAIVVIGGILRKKERTCACWERVAEGVSHYVATDPKRCMDVLALSYNHLPYHLKACFLYFGAFPEDFEIPVWILIRLWVAEGFIQQIGDVNLEDIAHDNLEDLVDRNLILVEKKRSNGGIKTCRIHDMLRDFCIKEAEEENFFKQIKEFEKNPMSVTTENFRRLCVHSCVLDYISSKPLSPHVRSFLCFASEESVLPPENISFIPGAFKLLRVLDIRSISFLRFPADIIQLVHLRYLAVLGNFSVLPEATSGLWNLQTLIIETSSRSLDIRADIWKMLHLRHVYASGSSRLPSPPAKAKSGSKDPMVRANLQTISMVSPDSCTENILARTPNVKKLGIRGKLITLMEDKGGSSKFDNLSKLHHLETLKLLNDTFPEPPLKGKLPGLPHWYKFPPKLRKLTLSDTLLDWEHMSTLGMLPALEVLKLRENAFEGRRWAPVDGGFLQLKVLQLERTDLVQWEASGRHFPRLQRFILKHCQSLEVIPSGLWDISELQIMELYWPARTAAESARLIQKQQQQSRANNGLKLFVYPPDL